jgi:hypothetical protein
MLSWDSITRWWSDVAKALFSSAFERIRGTRLLVFFWSLNMRKMLRAHTRLRKNHEGETRV